MINVAKLWLQHRYGVTVSELHGGQQTLRCCVIGFGFNSTEACMRIS